MRRSLKFIVVLGLLKLVGLVTVILMTHLNQTPARNDRLSVVKYAQVPQLKPVVEVFYSIPRDVFYFWCGNRTFQFRHYLSVRSVFFHLKPYRVRLLYETEPISRELSHNTWLTELREEFGFFSIAKLDGKWCANKQRTIDSFLSEHGGIYIHENAILAGPLNEKWFNQFDGMRVVGHRATEKLIQTSKRNKGFILNNYNATGRPTDSIVMMPIKYITAAEPIQHSRIDSGTVEMISPDKSASSTLPASVVDKVLLFRAAVPIVPEDIWELDSEAGRLLRTAAYGKPDMARPVPDFSNLAPNIAHVVWSNNDTMRFSFYLCVLSLLEVAKVDKVFLHGDGPPTGTYWNMIKNHPRLHLVLRTLVDGKREFIYGNDVVLKREHVVDVLRVDIMYRYGGLYVDTDAIFFRPLTRELRAYDAVVSPDLIRRDFPDNYQNGVMLGKPGARFWRLHLETMRKYYDTDWLWNSCFTMYKIKERHPETLLNYPRLNTLCIDFKCHPYWEPHLRYSSEERLKEVMKQWRNNTFAMHHCSPDLPEYSSHEALLENNGKTLFGEVALYVLKQAGKLEFFQKLVQTSEVSPAHPLS